MPGKPVILDASALVAWFNREPGAELVGTLLEGSLISALNWAETLEAIAEFGAGHDEARAATPTIDVVAFTEPQAALTAALRPTTRSLGLSLADRACLSLAMLRDGAVYTADWVWADLGIGPEVVLIR